MAEGKLNRRTPWAAQSPDLWSNRQLFRLSRSHAACGFSAAQVIPPGKPFRLSPVGIGSEPVGAASLG